MDVAVLTGRQRCSILVDVRVLLEVIDRDSVDVNCCLGVSTATSGRVASLTVVETIVAAIAIARVWGQYGCAGSGKGSGGGGGSCRDAGNQMTDATSVRPLMLEKLLRCRHVRNRANRYGCIQYFVVCIKIFIVFLHFLLFRHIVNLRNAIRFVFASFFFVCASFLPVTTASSIAAISATAFVQLLSVDQFHRDKLLQSLQILAVHFYIIMTGTFDPQGLHRSGTLFVDGHSVGKVNHFVFGAVYHQHRRRYFGYFVDAGKSIKEPGPLGRRECHPHAGH